MKAEQKTNYREKVTPSNVIEVSRWEEKKTLETSYAALESAKR